MERGEYIEIEGGSFVERGGFGIESRPCHYGGRLSAGYSEYLKRIFAERSVPTGVTRNR